ncbi:MAG TPA: peptidyl-prolyl cis-trans isomerase [Solirubrobacterales bacterium]|nr:peptidyl-prolyl cis-trans isomerase [Solirubrobacterales bacterium]
MGAKRGQTKSSGGRNRFALILFGAVLVLLFAGFAVVQGIGAATVPDGDVAVVKEAPADISHVSEARFKHALDIQLTQEGKKAPKPGEARYESLESTTMSEILEQVWLEAEAEALGISVTDKQVQTEFEKIKGENFPTEAAYQEFLKQQHFTQADVEERVRLQVTVGQLQEILASQAPKPTDEQIKAYYEENLKTFTKPKTADVRVMTNPKKAPLEKAKAELEADNSPASWKKLAPKYSTDPSSNSKGGLQPGLTEELVTKEPLRGAIFDTPIHQLVGPFKYETNYLLIEPVKVTPPKVETLKEATPQITSTLGQELESEYFNNFSEEFQARWTGRSTCADGFVFERCANYAGSGHPKTAPPACYEANPKKGRPAECPAAVIQTQPALPGTVTILKPKGEPFVQHPVPDVVQKTEDEEAKAKAAEAKREEAAGE